MSTLSRQEEIQKIYEYLYALAPEKKLVFTDALLSQFTITGRAIWADETTTDAEKVDAFKWMNELLHRLWNIRFDFLTGIDDNRMRFYSSI